MHVRKGKYDKLVMKNNACADHLIVDEVQDMDFVRMRILVGILKNNGSLMGTCVGDFLQTIFSKALQKVSHPMMTWTNKLGSATNVLSTCFRCPAAHIAFVNEVIGGKYAKYDLRPLRACNTNMIDKPFLFSHLGLNKNDNCRRLAETLTQVVGRLIDEGVSPDKIAFISNKVNNNSMFEQLEFYLSSMYEKKGLTSKKFKYKVQYFKTGDGDNRVPIKWSKAKNSTVLVSIHGMKGMEYESFF